MSALDRCATASELRAALDRAAGSLEGQPVVNDDAECIVAALDNALRKAERAILDGDCGAPNDRMNAHLLESFTRIAAVSLAGIARLKRKPRGAA